MIEVWVVVFEIHYEGSDVEAVFSTREKASEYANKKESEQGEMGKMGTSYLVQRFVVDEELEKETNENSRPH